MDWTDYKSGNIPTKFPDEFRILSIDGGGMKGVIPAVYLKRVEDEIGAPIHDYFDLITGTSTGGIIALGLSSKISAEEISKLYIEKGATIFSKRLGANIFLRAKYKNNNLKKILQNTFGELKVADASTMVCIPSIEHFKAEPKVYKTPHHKDFLFDGKRYMWEVALATSAAPIYFPAAEIGENELKIDGGLWANNPVLVGIAEAKKVGFNVEQIRVLSLGTGEKIYNADNKVAKKSGLLQWGRNIVELTFQVQSKSANYTANYLLGDRLCRITPTLAKSLKLDSVKKEDIDHMIKEAHTLYQNTYINQKVKDNFFQRKAAK
ncbi:CBASS cGAMP-activated phospholipase [Virgibacillus oceani]